VLKSKDMSKEVQTAALIIAGFFLIAFAVALGGFIFLFVLREIIAHNINEAITNSRNR